MRKRIYSILLAIALLATIIPITVLAEDPHTHIVNGETVPFDPWTSDSSLPTTSGSYYLTKDVTFQNSRWEIPNNQTINLCLNGHVIKLNGAMSGNNNISINLGATLNLYDCGTAEHKFTVNANGLWTLNDSATEDYETIIGGCITGGKNGIGGAIYLSWTNDKNVTGAVLNLYGGNIVGNQSTSTTQGGGAIFVDRPSTFNMYGGKIVGNTAKNGGAVYINDDSGNYGTFNMSSGTISNNTASSNGGGVYVSGKSDFTMNGGEISNCAANIGAGVYNDGYFTMNDGTITGNNSGNDGAGVYVDTNGQFTMNNGTISANTADANGGGVFINDSTFTMNDGTISDNTGHYGAGVCGLERENTAAKITMNDGTISGNTCYSTGYSFGGGVHINKITFDMNGGTISENTANLGGGLDNSGTFNMNGGSISNNTATDLGGGVNANGTFNMFGGEITNNTATNHSGGVCVNSNNATIGGTAKITGNVVGGTSSNAHLMNNKFITIGTGDKAPQEGMSVGITMQNPPGQFTSISATSGDEQYFTSDDSTYGVFYNLDGFLELKLTRTVTFDANGHGTAPDDITVPDGSTFTEPTAPTETGYTFGGWYKEADCKNAWNFDSDTVTENVTLYAQWTKNPTPKPDPDPTPEPEPINYKITQGANSIWVVAAGESPVFRSNADFSKFSHVLLDGKELAKKHYKYESGSTLITLTPEYTATLAVGKHTIEIVSTDGSASTVFYIEETIADTNGEGFALSTATMSSLFVACNIVGLSAVFFEIKKKKKVR